MNAESSIGLVAKRVGLVLVTIGVALLATELTIRVIDLIRGDGFFSSPRNIIARSKRVSLPFRTFGIELYREVDGVTMISSRHGELYPIEKPEGTLRIVCFGGSYGDHLDAPSEDERTRAGQLAAAFGAPGQRLVQSTDGIGPAKPVFGFPILSEELYAFVGLKKETSKRAQ